MTKVERLVVAVVAQGQFPACYNEIYKANVSEDECLCCVDSAYPWMEDDARMQAELNAALLCTSPVPPLWMGPIPTPRDSFLLKMV